MATDAFQKTLRGEARLVVGRKGSGKSAVFFQVKQRLSRAKQTLVVDLKPDGFQLISLKESFAPILSPGSLEHIITAFWEYVLFCEIGRQFLKEMKLTSRRDPEMSTSYRELQDLFETAGTHRRRRLFRAHRFCAPTYRGACQPRSCCGERRPATVVVVTSSDQHSAPRSAVEERSTSASSVSTSQRTDLGALRRRRLKGCARSRSVPDRHHGG